MLPPAPPPLTELERLVLDGGYPSTMGLETAADRVRQWLRREIDWRLREVAKGEQVEL